MYEVKLNGLLDDQCLVPEDGVLPGEVVAGLVTEGGSVLLGQLHVGGDVLQGRDGLARLAIESTIYGVKRTFSVVFVTSPLYLPCREYSDVCR